MLLAHEFETGDEMLVFKILFVLAYAAVALTSIKLLVESHAWSVAKHALAALVAVAIIIGFVWSFVAEATAATHAFFSLAVVLSLMFAPYIKRPGDPSSVWYFNYQTGVAVFFAGFAALILGAGLSLIAASIGYLFEIKIPGNVYGDVWILSWGLLFPIYILSKIRLLI